MAILPRVTWVSDSTPLDSQLPLEGIAAPWPFLRKDTETYPVHCAGMPFKESWRSSTGRPLGVKDEMFTGYSASPCGFSATQSVF